MGNANPTIPGWGAVEMSISRTLTWDDHGKTLYTVSGGDDPVEITLPAVADHDGFMVRVVQLTENLTILTTSTAGVYDKFLMPNTPGVTEKLEPGGRGFAFARVELRGFAGIGWLIVGGDGMWQDVDTSDNKFPLSGNFGGSGGNVVGFDANGQLSDGEVTIKNLATFSSIAMQSGVGSPNGVVEGWAGQTYQDTGTGDLYMNTDGVTAWVRIYDAP